MQVFQELNNEGKTIVMVTSQPNIARHSKRIVSMRDGQIVEDENVSARLQASALLQAA